MKTSLSTGAAICSLLLAAHNVSAQSTNFVLACSRAVATGPTCVAVADVNGDGKPDLICASGAPGGGNIGALTVLTNDGTGVFVSNATLQLSGLVPCVVAADVNGDGKPDLIALMENSTANLVIFTNNGSGVFGSNATINLNVYISDIEGQQPAESLAAVDLNGDGKPDLLVATGSIYTNNGSGKFGLNATLSVPSGTQVVVAGDFNGDGSPDAVSGGGLSFDPSLFDVFLNNGKGILTSNFVFNSGENSWCLVPADVNSDGKTDLVCYDAVSKTLKVFTNFVNGAFFNYSNAAPTLITNLSWIAAADFNGDRKVDLVSADPVANTLTVFTNNGIGQFGYNDTVTVGTRPVFVVAVDVNGDGKPDLISVNQLDNTLTVLTNATVIPIPPLTILQDGNQSAVLWPATRWNFVLQTTTNLGSGSWTTVTNGTTNVCLTVSNASPSAYYRLQPR